MNRKSCENDVFVHDGIKLRSNDDKYSSHIGEIKSLEHILCKLTDILRNFS